ncbi:MAG: ATP-dependent DNA helicase [Candidatus Bathyarchaeia archaeon]
MDRRFVCRRCGEIYALKEYLEDRFCRKCGTLLKETYEASVTRAEEEKKKGFQVLVKDFFPYPSFRPFQIDAVKFAYEIIRNGKIGLLSSPCGTGKSISVLTAFFAARKSIPSIGKLLVLTRTRNQLEIYARELKNIKNYSGVSFTASVFKSKREMCPYTFEDPNIKGISYGDFLHYCKGLKSGLFGGSCAYYDETYDGWKPSWRARLIVGKIKNAGPLLPDEVYEICRSEKLCPYEITRILTRYADIVIGNYNYILIDVIRGSVLGRAGIKMKEVNCIFDEAHSLPYYAAGILSDELSSRSVARARKEVKTFEIDDSGFLDALCNVMIDFGKDVYKNYGSDVEHIIKAIDLINALSEVLDVDSEGLIETIHEIADKGEIVRQRRSEIGKSPISYLSRCADFLLDWIGLTDSRYARYVKVEVDREGKKHVKLGIRCLDPALTSSIINDLRSTILMSGTLWNPEYYIDILGLEGVRCQSLELPNPFPPENRLIIVDKSVTTKFERRSEIQWKRIAYHLEQLIQKINGRIAVYFPSYEVMQEVSKVVNLNSPLLVEERDTKILDALKFLKDNDRCVVFGVARGKVSEGVDMTEEGRSMLSAVIIVGLPFPKKTELQLALHKYFQEKFREKAMEYANDIPCLNALAQSAGRLIRSPEDRGIIAIMDGRAAGRFKDKLPEDWKSSMEAYFRIERILSRIEVFFGS